MLLPVTFLRIFLPILTVAEETNAVFFPDFSSISESRATVVVFPLVPVTPTTIIFLEGNPYLSAEVRLKTQWYAEYAQSIAFFIFNACG